MSEGECRIIRGQGTYQGKQQLAYGTGISTQSAGSHGLCLHTLVIPPGSRAKAHLHENHESAIYLISGEAEMWWGEALDHHAELVAGDFVYIPAGVPHLPANRSQTEPATAVVARTDPNEQESVVLRPDLDDLAVRDGTKKPLLPPLSRSGGSSRSEPPRGCTPDRS